MSHNQFEAVKETKARKKLIAAIHAGCATAGISINPYTPLSEVFYVLQDIDLLLGTAGSPPGSLPGLPILRIPKESSPEPTPMCGGHAQLTRIDVAPDGPSNRPDGPAL